MIPKAVREQAERSEALHQAILDQNTAPVAAPAQPSVEPPVQPTATTPEPAPAPAETQPASVTEPAPAPRSPDPWELRYKALEGKYRAEVPALHQQVRELKAEVERLKAAAPTTAPAPDSVRETYGEDFANAVAAVADSRVQEVRSQLDEVKKATAQSARASFMQQLAAYVPNFVEVDADPGFTAYLDEFDPMTGRARREFFNEADAANDAARVASFFANYLQGKKPVPPPPAPPPPPSVEPLVVPESGRQSTAPPAKKVWTRSEIRSFYAAARRGVYTPEQYRAIDADITAAQFEGRLIG